jgi:4-hydroxybenzoate polyprenyltransferase
MIKHKPLQVQLRGLIRLTRWREYVTFVIPLTILGALLAARPHGILLDWRLIAVTAANILAVCYAFMINDIEDAPDDARDPDRAARNPITTGEVGMRFGYNVCRIVAAATLCLYAFGGLAVLVIGITTVLLSHLYSWRPVRLKAWPGTDIISHSLMLSGLLLLAGYFTYHNAPGMVWFVAGGATLFSVYGQLYNQLRDYDMDKQAGLFNTAIMLGETNTRRMMYLSIALALGCILVAIYRAVFPIGLGAAFLGSMLIASMITENTQDMRGGEAVDASGRVQVRGLIVLNLTVGAWLAWQIGEQMIQLGYIEPIF